MELRQLKYFLVVAEELHFRRAAERLFMSQPPLSRQIKDLEEELGVQLFDRSNKKVSLTEAGSYLKEAVSNLLDQVDGITLKVRQIEEAVSGQLKIGYIGSTIYDKFAEVLKSLREAFPFVKTRLYEMPTFRLVKELEEGRMDVCILRAPLHSDQLEVVTLFTEPFTCVVPSGLSGSSEFVSLKEFRDQPFIFFNKDFAPEYYNFLVQICQRAGFTPQVEHEANNIHSVLRLVEGGLGVSIVPRSLGLQYPELNVRFIDLDDVPLQTEVVLAWKRGNDRPPVQRFVKELKERFKSLDQGA